MRYFVGASRSVYMASNRDDETDSSAQEGGLGAPSSQCSLCANEDESVLSPASCSPGG